MNNLQMQIEDEIRRVLQGRVTNAIPEMITYCLKQGITEDDASYLITQVVKGLSDDLLPLRLPTRERILD